MPSNVDMSAAENGGIYILRSTVVVLQHARFLQFMTVGCIAFFATIYFIYIYRSHCCRARRRKSKALSSVRETFDTYYDEQSFPTAKAIDYCPDRCRCYHRARVEEGGWHVSFPPHACFVRCMALRAVGKHRRLHPAYIRHNAYDTESAVPKLWSFVIATASCNEYWYSVHVPLACRDGALPYCDILTKYILIFDVSCPPPSWLPFLVLFLFVCSRAQEGVRHRKARWRLQRRR